MEILLELLMEVIVGGSLEAADDEELPKGCRIGCLSFVSLIYLIIVGLFVYLLLSADNVGTKVILAVVLFLLGALFIKMWYKIIKSKK